MKREDQVASIPLEIINQVAKSTPSAIVETLSEAWHGLIGDRVAAFRLKNAAKLQMKVRRELEALGTSPDLSRVPERYAITWFDEATKQDEPEIQDLFARLLAHAAAGQQDAADRRILAIVGEMTPDDAIAFKTIFEFSPQYVRNAIAYKYALNIADFRFSALIAERLGDRTDLAIEHLQRLGLIEPEVSLDRQEVKRFARFASGQSDSYFDERLELKDKLIVTQTGWSLYRAIGLDKQLQDDPLTED